MACFWMNQQETLITIPDVEEIDSVTYYKIRVDVNKVEWIVSHRYNDFYELHNQLVNEHGVSKDLLPPKRLIGNKEPAFVEQRRKGLEKYLQETLCYLKRIMPKLFTDFLHFHKYEVCCLLQNLAFKLCSDVLDSTATTITTAYSINPVQLHAISESLKNPHPGFDRGDNKYDIGHVFDFFSKVNELTIQGIPNKYLESNITPNTLPFDFIAFKVLKVLRIIDLHLDNVTSAESARKTVQSIYANKCLLTSVSQVVQCDVIHKSSLDDSQKWPLVTHLDLSENNLRNVDKSISLVPLLKKLNLSQNKLTSLDGLAVLKYLTHLNVSSNLLTTCEDLKTKLPNLLEIDISQNSLSSLKGFEDMLALETLDVSFNEIKEIDEVAHIKKVPLKNFILTGNAVATTVDYRLKILEIFGDYASQVWLDNEKTSQAEVDKVQLLCALRIVKEGKIPNLNSPVSYK